MTRYEMTFRYLEDDDTYHAYVNADSYDQAIQMLYRKVDPTNIQLTGCYAVV